MIPETTAKVPAALAGIEHDPLACQFCPGLTIEWRDQEFTHHSSSCPAVVACRYCDSEVRLRGHRFRVIHAANCPWWQPGKHSAIPCGYTVTHRGPYIRYLSLVDAQ